jgi:hypothetical protein
MFTRKIGLGFNIQYKNRFSGEYDIKRVYFVSCRLRDKIYRDNFDSLDYRAQSRSVEGLCTVHSQFKEPETRLLKSCIGY